MCTWLCCQASLLFVESFLLLSENTFFQGVVAVGCWLSVSRWWVTLVQGLSSLLPFPYLYPTWIFGAGDSGEFWPTGVERFVFLIRPSWVSYHPSPLAAVLVRKSWAGSPSFARWRWDLSSDRVFAVVYWWLPNVNSSLCNCDIMVFGVNEKTAYHNYHSSLTSWQMSCTVYLITYSTFLAIKSAC